MSVGSPDLLIEAEGVAERSELQLGGAEIAARSPLELFWRRFRTDRVALASLGVIAMLVGVTLGMVAAFYRGWVDTAISRLIDVLLAFPILLLALGLATACSLGHGCFGGAIKPGLIVVIFVIAFVNWTYIARIVRGQVLSLREKEFVEAARALGASNRRIIFKE